MSIPAVGQPAPPIEVGEWVAGRPEGEDVLAGRNVILERSTDGAFFNETKLQGKMIRVGNGAHRRCIRTVNGSTAAMTSLLRKVPLIFH